MQISLAITSVSANLGSWGATAVWLPTSVNPRRVDAAASASTRETRMPAFVEKAGLATGATPLLMLARLIHASTVASASSFSAHSHANALRVMEVRIVRQTSTNATAARVQTAARAPTVPENRAHSGAVAPKGGTGRNAPRKSAHLSKPGPRARRACTASRANKKSTSAPVHRV